MKVLSSRFLLTAAIAASLASCSSLTGLGDSFSSLAGDDGEDPVAEAVESPALNVFTLPPSPAVGQSWTMETSGMKTTTAIVAEVDGQLIVEQEESITPGVILAFQVDPKVDMMKVPAVGEKFQSNVTAAWAGAPGKAPKERKVMEAMVMPEMTGEAAPAVDMQTGNESVELGNRTWNAEWAEVSGSKSWSVDGFILRSDYNGDTMTVLTEWKTDAKPALDWTPAK